MITILSACWAPEMAQPSLGTGVTAPASAKQPEMQSFSEPVPQAEQKEIDTQARTPPYTAWTTEAAVPLVGPNGNSILVLPNRGTRVEVLKVVPGYAQVICSGCLPPRQNQAGWIKIEQVALEWDLAEGDPLLTMLEYRRNWLRNKDTPKELSDRNNICLLFNSGYSLQGDTIVWKEFGGQITFTPQEDTWIFFQAKAPTEAPNTSFRCDIQYPKAEREKLP